MGMAGDMFSATLIGLGVPASTVTDAMERAARPLGRAKVEAQYVRTKEGPGTRIRVELKTEKAQLRAVDARVFLDAAVKEQGLAPPYAGFARRALETLIMAEREAHSNERINDGTLQLKPIGVARTPYAETAPRQPRKQAKGNFHVDLFPELATGLSGLEAFSHIYVISYLQRSPGYSLTVTPPWQDDESPRTVGVFASRSPNRPTPLGFSLTEVRRIEGNRIYTGPLDLFDGTLVVDIKPHVRTLDETDLGDDGWLAGSDHLQMHRNGVPHRHAQEDAILHEARDILLDILGAAKGLEVLRIALDKVMCLTPVCVGGGNVRFSHGVLPVPTPAVAAILKQHTIPHVTGPVNTELLTPTGAALLAALQPTWCPREMTPDGRVKRQGLGLGTKELEPVNGLRASLVNLRPDRTPLI